MLAQEAAFAAYLLLRCNRPHFIFDALMTTKSLCLILLALVLARAAGAHAAQPDTVRFASGDGKTELVGYLYTPASPGPHPAIVLLHGRGGLYSRLKPGTYTAESLTGRHRMWGRFWASRGYAALLVDSFAPRGYPDGFPRQSYSERPAAVSERFVRPLDAYGALAYLRSRPEVAAERIGVHGWSNGGMTVLSSMAADAPGITQHDVHTGFRAGLAQYPSCRTQLREPDYRPYAPLLILAAEDDDEVSPKVCETFAELMRLRGHPVELVLYEGAHHSYDDPGKTKQSHAPNGVAMNDSLRRAEMFFARHLKPPATVNH
jgi:dienelactone hydrolase